MASSGEITWQFNFSGLDVTINKLREIDRLLASISRHKGSVFIDSGNGTGGRISGGAASSAAGTAAGSAAGSLGSGVAAGGVAGIVAEKYSHRHPDLKPKTKYPVLTSQMISNVIGGTIKTDNTLFGTAGTPPKLSTAPLYNLLGSKNVDKVRENFSLGGVQKSLGSLASIITPLKIALAALAAVAVALHLAFKLLKEGIEAGSKAYQNAARHGESISSDSALNTALKSIGIDEEATSKMQEIAQFNRKAKDSEAGTSGQILGAARTSQFANVQQLANMMPEFEAALKDAQLSSAAIEASAKASQELYTASTAIGREWKALLVQMTALVTPVLLPLMEDFVVGLKMINLAIMDVIKTLQFFHLIPKGVPGTEKISGLGNNAPTASPWEKIGFVFGGSGSDGLAATSKETAKNTARTATTLDKLQVIWAALKPSLIAGGAMIP
jgi:hypothetical protein